jgi:hypothetical protein
MDTTTATFLSALALSSPLWLGVIAGKIKTRHENKQNQTLDMIEEALHRGYNWGYEQGRTDAELETDPNYTPNENPFTYWTKETAQ